MALVPVASPDVPVDTWQIHLVTDPDRSGIPCQQIKLDVGAVQAGSRQLRSPLLNDDRLPDGCSDTPVFFK